MDSLDKISTPPALLEYMNDNLRYGYVGRFSNKIYNSTDGEYKKKFADEYFLQSPTELLNNIYGLCIDKVELERYWFIKNNYQLKTFLLWFDKGSLWFEEDANHNLTPHTFLAYKENNKWYWFEHSRPIFRGIHEFSTLKELIEKAKETTLQYAIKERGATEEDYSCLKYKEYTELEPGLSAKEIWFNIIGNKK